MAQFAELSVKLDQLLEDYEQTLTALKGDGKATTKVTNQSGSSNEFREEVIQGKTYRVISSRRING